VAVAARLRNDVLDAAKSNGWAVDTDTTRHGAISDQFTRSGVTLTCFWSQTPWSDARWDSGLLVGPDGARRVWKVAGDGGVLSVLQS